MRTNYSHEKVEIRSCIAKIHTEIINIRFMCMKRQSSWIAILILQFTIYID
jgi:hypothetical protein